MVLYPLAGRGCRADLSKFVDLGINIDYSGNVKFMQVPIVGDVAFVQEWAESKLDIIRKVLVGVQGLSKRQVALYLLRGAGHGCRIVYYLRCCPRDLIDVFVKRFDGELRRTFESIVGLVLSDSQWEQAALPVKGSGLGLCRAADIADAAYLSSRCDTFDDCLSIGRFIAC